MRDLFSQRPRQPQTYTDLKRAWVIWFSLLISNFVYLGIGYLVSVTGSFSVSPFPHNTIAKIRLILYLASLVLLFASIKICRKAHANKQSLSYGNMIKAMEASNISLQTTGGHPTRQTMDSSTFLSLVVSWCLADAVSMFGLVLFLLNRTMPDLVGFCLVGIFLMIINRPKPALLQKSGAMQGV